MFHNGSSESEVGREASGRGTRSLGWVFLVGAFLVVVGGAAVGPTWAQTPATPPSDPTQPSESQQQQPQQAPSVPTAPQQVPLQQYPIQEPGRPPITPATPPSTTIPPWTPPLPPPPSQTNIPAPFPFAPPGAPGLVGVPGGLTLPGAFAPTLATLGGATLEFRPTLRASEEYSDNFFQTTSRSQENFRSTLGPGFLMLLRGARTLGTVSATVDLVHDTVDNSGDEVKVFPSLNATVRYALTPRLSLTLSDTFVRNDSSSSVDRTGIRRGRQTSETNAASLTVDWLLDQVATQAYYRNVLFFNEGSNGTGTTTGGTSQSNSVTNILGLNATTRLATDYLVRAGYEFSRTDATGGTSNSTDSGDTSGNTTSHTVFGAVSRSFGLYASGGVSTSAQFQTLNSTRIYNASLFGAYGLPTGLSLSAAVGYSILESDTEDSSGTMSVNANASYRFAKAVATVGVFQDFQQTGQQGQNFGTVRSRSYRGAFLYQLTPFINTTLSVTYSENEPTGTGNLQGAGTQTTLTYGAAVNWQVLRWLVASLQYIHTKGTGQAAFGQGSTTLDTSGNFSENRAILSLFATF